MNQDEKIINAFREAVDNHKQSMDSTKQDKNLQLTLGELIEKLDGNETYYSKHREEEKPRRVRIDAGYNYPSGLGSYRGYYQDLAIRYTDDHEERLNAEELKEKLENAVGKVYTGYKGGQFQMSEETPVWLANWGNNSNTTISAVRKTPTQIILETRIVDEDKIKGEKL